jgi:hypothetical protein
MWVFNVLLHGIRRKVALPPCVVANVSWELSYYKGMQNHPQHGLGQFSVIVGNEELCTITARELPTHVRYTTTSREARIRAAVEEAHTLSVLVEKLRIVFPGSEVRIEQRTPTSVTENKE